MQKSEFVQRAWSCERKLYRIAHTMLSSDADCEDAVQEALLKAWAKVHTLRESAWFETWLVRILINECRQIWRKRPRAEVELIDNITADIPEGAPVTEAILALPPKVRIAMELTVKAHFDAFSYDETVFMNKNCYEITVDGMTVTFKSIDEYLPSYRTTILDGGMDAEIEVFDVPEPLPESEGSPYGNG